MENITIGEIGGVIAFLVGLAGGLLTLFRHAKNGLKEMLKGEFEGVNDNFVSVRREIHEVREGMLIALLRLGVKSMKEI